MDGLRLVDCPDRQAAHAGVLPAQFVAAPVPRDRSRPSLQLLGDRSTIGDPAVAWFDDQGQQRTDRGVVPGEAIADIGMDPNGWNPFGLAFTPDGTLYFAHFHGGTRLTDCGPSTKGGRVLK
jgi:hypothetical protein